jgi:hypothetical protein
VPENDTDEQIRRLTDAMKPLGVLVEQMAETARSWMAAVAAPDKESPGYGQGLRGAAERMAQLSGAWIEPVRRLSQEHARFAEEMATWAERHREFAAQVSEWAEAHRAIAEHLNGLSQPVLRYAELLNDTMKAVVDGMLPRDPEEAP